MDRKRVALLGALWMGLCLTGGPVWAQAYQLSGGETRGRSASPKYASQLAAFTSEFDLKSEATLKIGPAIPTGGFKALTGQSGIPQGAKLGISADLSYQYYFVPYFGVGVALGAQIFGYDFNTAITESYPGKMHTTGWEVYSAGLSLNVRIPIISKLYLIGQVQGRFGFMLSPMAQAVEKIPVYDPFTNKRTGFDRNVVKVMRPQTNMDFQLGTDFGLQYRVQKNWLVQLSVEYRYGVLQNSYKKTREALDQVDGLAFRYAALGINLGVTYAFGKKKGEDH
ncbi:MAG: hypothetical protein K2O46_02615 [Bacteroidales bacterium]|nr:hypothetical protein [Bacteroidales bacterium]